MTRLFIRLYLLMASVLAFSFTLDWFLIDYVVSWLPSRQTPAPIVFKLVDTVLGEAPEAEWPARLAPIVQEVPPFKGLRKVEEVVSAGNLMLGDADRLREGRIVYWEAPGYVIGYAKRLRQSDWCAVYELKDSFARRLILNLLIMGFEFVIVGIAMWLWVRPLWHELKALDQATVTLASGRFDVHVNIPRRSVLFSLAQSFNRMAERIGSLVASHKALTNAVSHELRTPLARLRFATSLALDDPAPAEKDRQLQRMKHDLDELDGLSAELLTLAKLERETGVGAAGNVEAAAKSAFPADEWLQDRIVDARATAEALGYQREISGVAELAELAGDPYHLARVLDNLLNNAIRYARAQIQVTVRRIGNSYELMVDDDGQGIPESERERVFEPFARLDASRDRASGGFGLGLSIVRQIARWHGGEAKVVTSPLGGARFIVSWPAA